MVSVSLSRLEEPQTDRVFLEELVVLICDQGGETGVVGRNELSLDVVAIRGDEERGRLISKLASPVKGGLLEAAKSWLIDGAHRFWTITLSTSSRLFLLLLIIG